MKWHHLIGEDDDEDGDAIREYISCEGEDDEEDGVYLSLYVYMRTHSIHRGGRRGG